MEIEQANRDGYRAISLPAESTSARVFAFDSKQGGFYEMDDVEVSRYVLGALRQIREERRKENLSDFTAWVMMGGMVFLGLRFISKYKNAENNSLLGAYLFCLFPLAWSITVLGKMDKSIVFSSKVSLLTWASLFLVLVSFALGCKWVFRKKEAPPQPSLLSLIGCTILITMISGGVMVYTLITYT